MKLPAIPKLGPTVWGIAAFLVVGAVAAPWIPIYPLTILIGLLVFAALAYSMNFITERTPGAMWSARSAGTRSEGSWSAPPSARFSLSGSGP